MKHLSPTVIVAALTSAFVAIIFALIFCGSPFKAGTQNTGQPAYEKVKASGTIRAAYAVGAPLFIIDPSTKAKSGIFHDLVEEAAKRLSLKVEWTQEIGYGEMIQGLSGNRYDIVGSGVWINSDRARGADFTIPVYYDAVYAYARPDDNRLKGNIQALNSPAFTISTMDGELGGPIAQAQFPNAKTLALPQNAGFAQMIANVVEHKADVVFMSAGAANEYLAVHPGQLRQVTNRPLRIFPNAIMLRQGEEKLSAMLDQALLEMANDGTVEAILRKYETVPNTFLRLAPPYQVSGAK